MKTKLTTTLNLLRAQYACVTRYTHLVAALGGVTFNPNESINLLTILETNGIVDCLWALCATVEDSGLVARFMAADFAEAVLLIYECEYPTDLRPRGAIEAARAFARGEITDTARKAAWSAAHDAYATAWIAAPPSATAAAYAAHAAAHATTKNTLYVAEDAAAAAIKAANADINAYTAVTRSGQAKIVQQYLVW